MLVGGAPGRTHWLGVLGGILCIASEQRCVCLCVRSFSVLGVVVAVWMLVLRCDPIECCLSPLVPKKSRPCPRSLPRHRLTNTSSCALDCKTCGRNNDHQTSPGLALAQTVLVYGRVTVQWIIVPDPSVSTASLGARMTTLVAACPAKR